MKKLLTVLAAASFAFSAIAADYVLTYDGVSTPKYFVGYAGKNFTPTLGLVPNSADTLSLKEFTGISSGASIDVDTLSIYKAAAEGSLNFMNGNTTIKAKTLNMYNADGSFNSNYRTVFLKGTSAAPHSLKLASATFGRLQVGNSGNSGTHYLSFSAYDDVTPSVINASEIYFQYSNYNSSAYETYGHVDINENVTLTATKFICDTNGTKANSTTINLNGGSLYIGSFTHGVVNDVFTFNHSSGVLGASSAVTIAPVSGGTLNYLMGQNAIFDTKASSITFGDSVIVSNKAGANGGFTVKGRGEVSFNSSISTLTGDIKVTDKSILNLNGGWAANASSVLVESDSVLNVAGDIALTSSSSITLGVYASNDFAQIIATGLLTGGNFGNLVFDINTVVLDGGSISIALNEFIISAGEIDWSKFAISSNVNHSIKDGVITFTVPEASSYAALFGVVALAFALYRRKK